MTPAPTFPIFTGRTLSDGRSTVLKFSPGSDDAVVSSPDKAAE